MISYVNISLFDSPAQALVNTVNTVGIMGRGIAAIFKQLYPEMYQQYRELCQQGKLDVGMLYIYRTPNKVIINFPTKKHWRQPSQVEYIEAGLRKFASRYQAYGISSVAFPQLGCGHGELDWETQVQPIMERHLRRLPIPVYIHLYEKSPTFVPERWDLDYAKQVRLERERISIDRLWQDLQRLTGAGYPLTLFGPMVEMQEEYILFRPSSEAPVAIYREDIEDLWNILRLRGTVRETDVPQFIRESGASGWLFDLLEKLDYIRSIPLRSKSQGDTTRGLRYDPQADTTPVAEAEIVV